MLVNLHVLDGRRKSALQTIWVVYHHQAGTVLNHPRSSKDSHKMAINDFRNLLVTQTAVTVCTGLACTQKSSRYFYCHLEVVTKNSCACFSTNHRVALGDVLRAVSITWRQNKLSPKRYRKVSSSSYSCLCPTSEQIQDVIYDYPHNANSSQEENWSLQPALVARFDHSRACLPFCVGTRSIKGVAVMT